MKEKIILNEEKLKIMIEEAVKKTISEITASEIENKILFLQNRYQEVLKEFQTCYDDIKSIKSHLSNKLPYEKRKAYIKMLKEKQIKEKEFQNELDRIINKLDYYDPQ